LQQLVSVQTRCGRLVLNQDKERTPQSGYDFITQTNKLGGPEGHCYSFACDGSLVRAKRVHAESSIVLAARCCPVSLELLCCLHAVLPANMPKHV
jgi:hypothetical protein